MTLKVHLINMPFASLTLPSIALTQLKAALRSAFGDRVSVTISYPNHDFARRIGPQLYQFISTSNAGHTSGLGEWMFRNVAFPDVSDNTAAYLSRYRYQFDRNTWQVVETQVLRLRERLGEFVDDVIRSYRIHEADVVGLTTMFFQNLPSIALARRLRAISGRQLIVMGGANCESTMGIELVTNVPIVDFVFSGMALVSFPQFIGHVLNDELGKCHRINGVFSRKNSTSAAALIEGVDVDWPSWKPEKQLDGITVLGADQDINLAPTLEYDDYFESLMQWVPELADKARIPFETSRGCWWGERAHCTFCGLNGGTMRYRAMQPDRAVAVMNGLFERYAQRANVFESVDNILPREYFSDVFPRLKVPEHISMFYEVKADLAEEQVRSLAQARVLSIQPGIEALATSTLKLMRKGTTAFHGVRLLSNCKKYGIRPVWNLLVGFPGETADVYQNYIKILPSLYHLCPPSDAFPVRFDRFSPYFFQEQEYGLKLAPYDHYAFCYPFPAVSLRNMAYYFQDTKYEAQYMRDMALSLAEMRRLVSTWKTSWASQSAPALELKSETGGRFITDTRGSSPICSPASDDDVTLLEKLAVPTREDELSAEQRDLLERMYTRGLIFRERGRAMSLIATI